MKFSVQHIITDSSHILAVMTQYHHCRFMAKIDSDMNQQ